VREKKRAAKTSFHIDSFLQTLRPKPKTVEYRKKTNIFVQGNDANAVFYVLKGRVRLTVTSAQGKAAIIAILNGGSFFGEGCLAGQILRIMTAAAVTDCRLVRIEKPAMVKALHKHKDFAEFFSAYLLSRSMRYEADLVDQLFNSSEKRLARILLLLARYGTGGLPEPIVPKISHEMLAQMVGTTRPHINRFMNKFKKLGFIDYNGGILVHPSLLNITLVD
jgi:CRP/FNR family transcriptional regulator, cyclic AMP receptor protein